MVTADKKRVMLTVAYDGSAYHGWQIQPAGRTVEGELNSALSSLCGEQICVTGASRTDAGVHALCNKAVFDTTARMPAEKFSYALNTYLPEDIRIRGAEEVAADFHPRRCACIKTYEYRILNAPFPDPTQRLYSFFTYVQLDVEKMRRGAAYFKGTHDFAAVSTFKPEIESTVRTITDIDVKRSGSLITLRVSGNGFLYHMVRIIAGTLMEVGRGRIAPEEVERILLSKDRSQAGPTAAACGLTLADLQYYSGH